MFHDLETAGSIHAVANWQFADAAERTGVTGLTSADEGKVAWQLDDDSLWLLTDYTVPTWVGIGGGGGGGGWVTAPSAPTDPGNPGDRAYDSSGFLYVCIASNSWVRFAGATWS